MANELWTRHKFVGLLNNFYNDFKLVNGSFGSEYNSSRSLCPTNSDILNRVNQEFSNYE